jgi:response regulator RpfG family c-di-GMP phosphodiesterase
MRMPEMDGATFLKEVRSRWPKVMRILLTGYADITSTVAAINEGEIYRYISKPWDDNEIVTIVREALERMHLKQENQRLSALTLAQNDELKALNASLEQKVAERTAELRQALSFRRTVPRRTEKVIFDQRPGFCRRHRIAQRFGRQSDVRPWPTGGRHARNLAQRLGMGDVEVQNIMLAGLLHDDIGKMGLPDELLGKAFNTLSQDQRALVMKHPVIGQNILIAIDKFKDAAILVRHHHESLRRQWLPGSSGRHCHPAGQPYSGRGQ